MGRAIRSQSHRSLRGRSRRARKGQVSAVATIFGLLLVVAYIAQFVIAPLPGQLALAELTHVSEVENQVGRLQVDVLALASSHTGPRSIVTPITLGTDSVPPFGLASPGRIGPDGHEYANLSYTTARVYASNPDWNATLGCSDTGSPCNQGTAWDNVTGTPNSTYAFKLNGGAPSLFLNFTGSYDSITVNWLGKSVGITYLEFNGSHLHITMDKGSNGGAGTSPRIVVIVYGQHDVVETALNGADITMRTSFIGDLGPLCPTANLSSTDRFYWNGTGNSATTVNVTWFNSAGYNGGPTTFSVGSGSTLSFQNVSTGFSGCAWTRSDSSTHPVFLGPGIAVTLENRYVSQTIVGFDHGAVVESTPGGGSQMVSPPPSQFVDSASGWHGVLRVVDVVDNGSSASGTGLIGVVTRLLSVDVANFSAELPNGQLLTGIWMNLTTAYPEAWSDFFDTLPNGAVAGGPTCTEIGTFVHPATCLDPPVGGESKLTVQFALAAFTLVEVTVAETLT